MSVKEDIMGVKPVKPIVPPVDISIQGAPQTMPVAAPKPSAEGRQPVTQSNSGKGNDNDNDIFLQKQITDANAKINTQQNRDEEADRVERFRQFLTNGGMTDEQKVAEEKRRKREQLWNSIGDGVSALSNLYYTTKGAPARKIDPRTTLSARTQERYDMIDAQRKADAQQMLNAYTMLQGADSKAAVDRARENYYGTLGINAGEEQQNKTKESEARVAGINATTGLTGQRTRTEEYNTGVAKAKADNQGALMESQIGANYARAKASKASAANSYAHAATVGNKGGSSKSSYAGINFNGRYGNFFRKSITKDEIDSMYRQAVTAGYVTDKIQKEIKRSHPTLTKTQVIQMVADYRPDAASFFTSHGFIQNGGRSVDTKGKPKTTKSNNGRRLTL